MTPKTASRRCGHGILPAAILVCVSIGLTAGASTIPQQAQQPQPPPAAQPGGGLLRLLGVAPSEESIDYVRNKTQFQLHTLLTEQRHPKTWNLGERMAADATAGLRMLLSVDEDVRAKLRELAAAPEALEQAAAAVEEAILAGRKVYVYGCGATGRLAKQMESAFWRPFWKRVRADRRAWAKLPEAFAAGAAEAVVGEMTGADRALISSLEGFEDLQLIGRLQLRDHGIRKGDVVICVTEGGETSSVIGTVLTALADWKAAPGFDPAASRKSLYFVYNNPDDRLRPFDRSRAVLEEPGITRINLTTGPQSITGSTRMQATTIETFVVGAVLETAAGRALRRFLSDREMARLGFEGEPALPDKLRAFDAVLAGVQARAEALAGFTRREAAAYEAGHFSTYFAGRGLITVFIDSTERSPTFRLYPLDTIEEPERKCWIQVWTDAPDAGSAWRNFLGRPFRGLASRFYREPFETEIDDPYLKQAALSSLTRAGDEQAELYDFSISPGHVARVGPRAGDLGVMVTLTPEEDEAAKEGSAFVRFARIFAEAGADLVWLAVAESPERTAAGEKRLAALFEGRPGRFEVVRLAVAAAGDPFGLRQQIAAKMALNAHSTAVMARLGKVIGNTMTNVSPSNLKLIGRATFLIQSHVNDVLARPAWIRERGRRDPVGYGEANAVLFDAIGWLRGRTQAGQTAEVALSIIRILESIRSRRGLTNEEAFALVQAPGLAAYLAALPPPG